MPQARFLAVDSVDVSVIPSPRTGGMMRCGNSTQEQRGQSEGDRATGGPVGVMTCTTRRWFLSLGGEDHAAGRRVSRRTCPSRRA